MIKIFLDTNQIIRHRYFLDSNVFNLFKKYVKKNEHVKLCVPKIVITETCRNFSQEVGRSPLIVKVFKKLTQAKDDNIKDILEWYETFLNRELENVGAIIVEYPNVKHEQIIERYMHDRRPFSKKKGDSKGYKDSLLWYSILEVIKEDKEASKNKYLLITDDSDFISKKENENCSLHRDLAIEVIGVDFKLIPGLKQFVDQHVEPIIIDIIPEEKLMEFLDNNVDILRDKLSEDVRIDKESIKLLFLSGTIPSEVNDYYVEGFYIDEVHIRKKYNLEDEKYLFQVQVLLEADIVGFVHKYDYYDYEDKLVKDYGWTVYDYDWNEWTMLLGKTIPLSLEVSIIYDKNQHVFLANTLQIESVEHWQLEQEDVKL
jgi:hypothetical protein